MVWRCLWAAALFVLPVILTAQELQSPIKLSSDVPYVLNRDGALLSFAAASAQPLATSTATTTTLVTSWSTPPLYVSLDNGAATHAAIQCHFHRPSEHWLNGRQYPFELHIVLANPANHSHVTAVVAVLFDVDHVPHPFLAQLWPHLKYGHDPRHGSLHVDLSSLRLHAQSLFLRYVGSLTTAPFTEGIEWIIHHQVQSMSLAQWTEYTAVFPLPNARPLQPRYDRQVQLIGPRNYVMDRTVTK
ncbi:hypothetical protein H310_09672 [Aphanomyces invadans]|uniref:Carbonic anhydrase n=1 Tax=Aphanomyces invadans TaxID=157072 RepID=A0A024TTG2_9STRA|nr:hypothetical protein H310_09672 [Aphanomyces invadans]ETV97333.1 hypothetical protein H310_09672 [Aphanomyces invadans]|eukprot:XP_008874041.1 hypothetical protein H310_09672 [Aphanomyces invadans]